MNLHRRDLILAGLAAGVATPVFAQAPPGAAPAAQVPPGEGQPPAGAMPDTGGRPSYATPAAQAYSRDELAGALSDFFGVTAESAGAVVEKAFHDHGMPTGYIAGEEAAGAFWFGLRYGKGLLYMKDRATLPVYWQGPSFGWDFGGNGARTFTLCYNLQYPEAIFRRYPGVEGSAYLIGGLGINYQRADDMILAPIRAGLGLRLGANVGYLSYSRKRNLIPI